MTGELVFNGSKCYFTLENYVLDVYCLNGEAKNLLWEEVKDANGVVSLRTAKKDLPSDRLEGVLFGHNEQTIILYVYIKGYGFNGGLLREKTILHINVSRYLIVSQYASQGNYLVFRSKQFHKFLNIMPNYKYNDDYNGKLAEVTYHADSKNNKALYTYDNNEFTVYPTPHCSIGGSKFEFAPQLVFSSNSAMNEKELIALTDKMITFFQVLFMRTNIFPDEIFYTKGNIKIRIYYNRGTDYIDEKEKVDSFQHYGFISWDAVYPYFQTIMDDISSGLIDTKYIGNNSKERTYITFEKVSMYSAFFEKVYYLVYGTSVKHKSSSQKEIDYIKVTLESIKDKKRKNLNKKIDFLITQLDHIALSTKIKKVFKDYEGCLKKAKSFFMLDKYTNEDIANKCAFIRNKIDHGDAEGRLDPHIASCFAYLNCSIYAMLLKKWGLDDSTISHQLEALHMVDR